MKKNAFFLAFFLLFFCNSCNYFAKKKPVAGAGVIARVQDDFLYLNDIQPLVQGASKEDSAKIVTAYAESWVKKNLMLRKAKEYISEDETGITKKVESYRESLLLYEYEKQLIQQKLDQSVTDKDVEEYYEQHKTNYPLEHDIDLINYIVISPEVNDFKLYAPLFNKLNSEDDLRTVDGYCKSFAKSYNITDGVWRTTQSICDEFGLSEKDVASIPMSKTFKRLKTGDVNTYLRIADIKRKGDPMPLPLVKDQVREALLDKKKIILLRDMYDKLLDESKKKEDVEIFVK
ncbi:MAG TPA: hypothetical protein VGB95_04665 [Chitinophagales bacterium]